jgi:hypothetical protein
MIGVITVNTVAAFDGTTVTTPRLAFSGTTLPSAGTATLFSRTSDNNTYLQTGSGNTVYLLDGSQNTMYGAAPALHIWQISNAEKMRLDTNVLSLTALQGIKFQATQSSSADANTLDDYEEGTYTPTQANFSTTGTLTITGRYIKIGNIIHFSVLFSSTGTIGFSTSAFISTPFTVKQATGNITMRVNSNSVSFNGNQSGAQCNTDEAAQARFFVGSFTTTSAGQGLIFAGTFEQH